MMINLMIIMITMLIIVLAILFWPFFRKTRQTHAQRHQINIAIYQDVISKLEQDHAFGKLDEYAYHEAVQEARVRLLQEVPENTKDEESFVIQSPKTTLFIISLMLPLFSIGLYGHLGSGEWINVASSPSAFSASTPTVNREHTTDEETRRVVAEFATRLEQQPNNNPKGWALLGRSYKFLQRLEEAEQAFEKAGSYLDNDAQLLAEYADVVVLNANGMFVDKAIRLVEKALQVDPNNMMALWLAGTAAYYQQDIPQAIAYWKKLLVLLPPGSEDAQSIRTSILNLGGSLDSEVEPKIKPKLSASTPSNAKNTAQRESIIQGTIQIDPALQANITKTDTIFIIARPPNRRMPVAVIREPLAGFSLKFTLDDSRAMNPNMPLSSFSEVHLEARISKSGMAMPATGDLISNAQMVKLGTKSVVLKIDQIRQ